MVIKDTVSHRSGALASCWKVFGFMTHPSTPNGFAIHSFWLYILCLLTFSFAYFIITTGSKTLLLFTMTTYFSPAVSIMLKHHYLLQDVFFQLLQFHRRVSFLKHHSYYLLPHRNCFILNRVHHKYNTVITKTFMNIKLLQFQNLSTSKFNSLA